MAKVSFLIPSRVALIGLCVIGMFFFTGCKRQAAPITSTVDGNSRDVQIAVLRKQIADAQARVQSLEQHAYADNPKLPEAQKRLAELNIQEAMFNKTLDLQATQYMAEQKKKRGNESASDDLELLVAQWELVRDAEWISDPKTAEYLRVARLARPDFVPEMGKRLKAANPELKDTDLSDPAILWKAYGDTYIRRLPTLRDTADQMGKTQDLPPYMLDWARQKAQLDKDGSALEDYLDVATPENLQQARQDLDALIEQLTQFGSAEN